MVIPFLSFKGATDAYVQQILITHITHSKERIPLSNLLVNSISARSASQILFLKDENKFCFSNFLIIV